MIEIVGVDVVGELGVDDGAGVRVDQDTVGAGDVGGDGSGRGVGGGVVVAAGRLELLGRRRDGSRARPTLEHARVDPHDAALQRHAHPDFFERVLERRRRGGGREGGARRRLARHGWWVFGRWQRLAHDLTIHAHDRVVRVRLGRLARRHHWQERDLHQLVFLQRRRGILKSTVQSNRK